MATRLQEKQKEKISDCFDNHPLMIFCAKAFTQFQRQMPHLQMLPVEIFSEAIEILDLLLEDNSRDTKVAVSLWDDLYLRYQQWEKTADEKEINLAIACVYASVIAAMSASPVSRHYHTTCLRLCSGMNDYISDNPKFITSIEKHLDACNDELKKWIKDYVKSDEYISDTIADLIKFRTPTEKNDEEERIYDRGTFIKTGVMDVKLSMVQNEMFKNGWIVQDDPDKFLALFSGKCNDVKLVWRNGVGIGNLLALFKEMVKGKFIKCPDGYSIQEILEYHFVNENGEHLDLHGSKKSAKAQIIIDTCISYLEMPNPGTDE